MQSSRLWVKPEFEEIKELGALDGVKVVDLTWAVAGPLTTKYLADHGATIVRVESPLRPCILRTAGPFKDGKSGINRSGYFAFLNANKYSIGIDLNKPDGIEIAKRLVAWGDVVAESFVPGVMEKMGLGYDELIKTKHDIVMFRTSAQGATGPSAGCRSLGFQLVGLSGFTELTGWDDGGPVQPFGAYTDLIAPRFGAAAIIAALDHRNKTGEGQCIDLSQLEASMQFLAPQLLDYRFNGNGFHRNGNACSYAAPHNVYACRGEERWCALAVFTDSQWDSLCSIMGKPELSKDTRFCNLLSRKRNEAELDRIVQEWTGERSPEDVVHKLQGVGVPAGIVESAADMWADPQLTERRHFWTQEHPEIGPVPALGQSFFLSRTPSEQKLPAPCLGEHTYLVCKEFLNMSDDEIAEQICAGVLH